MIYNINNRFYNNLYWMNRTIIWCDSSPPKFYYYPTIMPNTTL